jgi:hypothetical protein
VNEKRFLGSCEFNSGIWDPVPFDPLDPGSGTGKISRSGSGMHIPDHISETLVTISWVKILKFFDADADPEWKKIISGIRDKHPGSATLVLCLYLKQGPKDCHPYLDVDGNDRNRLYLQSAGL